MPEEKVAVEVSVTGDGKAKQSVASLRQQIREATQEATSYAHQFGIADDRTVQAAKHLAELKETWQKTQQLAAGFNPDRKFEALSTAIRGTMGGFEAFQGAIGLLGVKSKDLEEQLLKVQSAMAMTQGINEILALKDSLGILVVVVKDYLVNAFRALKAAIGSTGIGLLVIALGTLWANFDKIKKSVTESVPFIKDMTENWDKFMQVVYGVGNVLKEGILGPINAIVDLFRGDFGKVMDDVLKGGDIVGNFQKGKNDKALDQEKEYQKERLEAIIKSTEQEIEVRRAAGKETLTLEHEVFLMKQALYKDDKEKLEENLQGEKVLMAGHYKALEDAEKKRIADAKKRREEEKRRQQQEYQDQVDRTKAWIALIDEFYDSQRKIREEHQKEEDKKEQEGEDQRFAQMNADAERINKLHADQTAAEIAIDQEKLHAKQVLHDSILSLLESSSELAGKSTAAGKAFAVASTTITTLESAQAAFYSQFKPEADATSPIRGAIAAAAALASGMVRVKAILAVKIPGSSSGISTPSIPNVSNGASAISNFRPATGVKIDADQINALGDQRNNRVFVVDRDITRQQQRTDRIQRAAVIGGR